MNKSIARKKISSQRGLSDLKKLVEKWEIISENLARSSADIPFILPDLFLISARGTGRTLFLTLLSEYLCENPCLMSFYGNVRYFEFELQYCSPEKPFGEISRFVEVLNEAKGFRNEYRGIVYLDVDDWVGHCSEPYFKAFMEYVSDNGDGWLVVFSVSDEHSENAERMEAFMHSILHLERVVIERPNVDEFAEYAQEMLNKYNISMDDASCRVIRDTLNEMRVNDYFEGYKTVKRLCDEIAYSAYSDKDFKNVLTAEHVLHILQKAKDTREKLNRRTAGRIGF
jgi:hypothetical protein